jgi:adenine-specific DNA-methyltransferase
MSKEMSIEKLDLQSPDLVNQNFEKLAALFPNCVKESTNGKAIDFDLLKQELNHSVVDGNKERYRLEWPGKREAIVTANLPTTKTLRPVREESVAFDTTENLYIEGDNLEVLKLLQESYLSKVKMIYIDPPYNTGKDFVYNDNFNQSLDEYREESGLKDDFNNRLIVNPDTSGRYHSNWLSMIYPRIKLARNLLKDDGLIFISIDDNEAHNLRKVCDEIFGEENHVGTFVWQSKKGGGSDSKTIVQDHEYVLCFSKNSHSAVLGALEIKAQPLNKIDEKGKYLRGRELNKWGSNSRRTDRPTMWFPIKGPNGEEVYPIMNDGEEGRWRYGYKSMHEFVERGDIDFVKRPDGNYIAYEKIRSEDPRLKPFRTWINDVNATSEGSIEVRELFDGKKVFDFPKPISLLKRCLSIGTSKDDLVLDFFSGSASIVPSILELNLRGNKNLKFICIQLPEITDEKSEAYKAGYFNICEIGKERIKRASSSIINKYKSLLIEKVSKLKKINNNQLSLDNNSNLEQLKTEIEDLTLAIKNLDAGFRVYRISDSNMEDVYYKPQDYNQGNLDLFADNVKPDRTAEDLLAQVMLDWGLQLSSKIEQSTINGKQLFKVSENSLYACFDKGIDEDFAKAIAKDAPLRIVFRDGGFKNDTAKTNVKQLLKQLSPETEMKVI